MAHRGQEIRLRLAGGLSRIARGAEFLFRLLPGGHVLLDRHEVGDFTVLAQQGRQRNVLPIGLAGFLLVEIFTLPHLPALDGVPQFRKGFLVKHTGFQYSERITDDVLGRIAAGPDKCRIDVFDKALWIGDDDRGGALFNRRRQFADLCFGKLAFGDVGVGADEAAAGNGAAPDFDMTAVGALAFERVHLELSRPFDLHLHVEFRIILGELAVFDIVFHELGEIRADRGQFGRISPDVEKHVIPGNQFEVPVEGDDALGHRAQHTLQQVGPLLQGAFGDFQFRDIGANADGLAVGRAEVVNQYPAILQLLDRAFVESAV